MTFHTSTPCFTSDGNVWLRCRNSISISSVNVSIVIPIYRLFPAETLGFRPFSVPFFSN